MITDGSELTTVMAIKMAIKKGFALKLMVSVCIQNEELPSQSYWEDVVNEYANPGYRDVLTMKNMLHSYRVYAVPMAEYEGWYVRNW